MTATFRKSQMTKLLSLLAQCADGELNDKEKKELLEKLIKEATEKAKNDFLGNLSPLEVEAYKLGYQVLLERAVFYKTNTNDWYNHFLKKHDEILILIKNQGIFEYVCKEYTDDFLNNVIRKDKRELFELVGIIANYFAQAKQEAEKHKEILKEKLYNQLNEVVETLNELTSEKDGVKEFEIETENAVFKILTNIEKDEDEEESETSNDDNMSEFIEFLKKLSQQK